MSFSNIRSGFLGLASVCLLAASLHAAEKTEKKVPPVLDHTMKSLTGKKVDLEKYDGKVLLIVNVASRCGYTPQYAGLQKLHEKYASKGLAVLGFPCNQFGLQEPGSEEEIAEFCQENYGVKFDMFAKVDVNGDDQCELYEHLTSKETNPKSPGPIRWNFEKFLIGRDGKILGRYKSSVKPLSEELMKEIEQALEKK